MFLIFICWPDVTDPIIAPCCSAYQRTLHQKCAVQPQQRRALVFSCWERTVKGEPHCTESSLTTSALSSLTYRNPCHRWVKKSHKNIGQNIAKSASITCTVHRFFSKIPLYFVCIFNSFFIVQIQYKTIKYIFFLTALLGFINNFGPHHWAH